MNTRKPWSCFVPMMRALGVFAGLAFTGASAASAQSIIVTTPFPYCVNREAYPAGTYAFTMAGHWILSIRNVEAGAGHLFAVQPEDEDRLRVTRQLSRDVAGLTFRTTDGGAQLQAVQEGSVGESFVLAGNGRQRAKCSLERFEIRHSRP